MAGQTFQTPKLVQFALGTIEGVGTVAGSVASPFLQASIEKRRLSVKAAEARREAELRAAERTNRILDNQNLFQIVKWLSGTIAASAVAFGVGSFLKKRRRKK